MCEPALNQANRSMVLWRTKTSLVEHWTWLVSWQVNEVDSKTVLYSLNTVPTWFRSTKLVQPDLTQMTCLVLCEHTYCLVLTPLGPLVVCALCAYSARRGSKCSLTHNEWCPWLSMAHSVLNGLWPRVFFLVHSLNGLRALLHYFTNPSPTHHSLQHIKKQTYPCPTFFPPSFYNPFTYLQIPFHFQTVLSGSFL